MILDGVPLEVDLQLSQQVRLLVHVLFGFWLLVAADLNDFDWRRLKALIARMRGTASEQALLFRRRQLARCNALAKLLAAAVRRMNFYVRRRETLAESLRQGQVVLAVEAAQTRLTLLMVSHEVVFLLARYWGHVRLVTHLALH